MDMYTWEERENNVFEIITDNYDVYYLILKPKEHHIHQFCAECNDIYEIDLKCTSTNPQKDFKLKRTVINILREQLTYKCVSLVYVCDDVDRLGYCREYLFDKWFDEEADEEIEKFVKTHCGDVEEQECLNMYFIADKNCSNYEENANDFLCDHLNIEQED